MKTNRAIDSGADVLLKGGVVALPTDTIYGLAADATNKDGIEKLYAIKGRNPLKPISIAVGKLCDVHKFSKVTIPDELLSQLLPGPYTLLFESIGLEHLNPHTNVVGVRIPENIIAQSIAEKVGAIALTSANISGEMSPLKVDEFSDIHPAIDLIIDDGQILSNERSGSTIVNLVNYPQYTIVRKGQGYVQLINLLKQFS